MNRNPTHAQAIECHWTGTIRGAVFYDDNGTAWRQVFEYANGSCTDAYVTRAGVQF